MEMVCRIACGAVALALVFPSAGVGQVDRGVVSGVVVSSASGEPIPGALVLLDSGLRAFTDAEGRFALGGLSPGPYRIAAVTPGCHVGLGNVEVPTDGRVIRLRIAVDLPGDTVAGRWALGERSEGTSMRVVTAEENVSFKVPRALREPA